MMIDNEFNNYSEYKNYFKNDYLLIIIIIINY